MKDHEIEVWARNVIEAVKTGKPYEDSRVELKAEWPADAWKAARRIAGHCNAARGSNILWLIGVDESQGVIGACDIELSNWIAQIDKMFDDMIPRRIANLNVHIDGKVVVAIVFETNRPPYVVKNKREGGAISADVPWRDATKIRSATRSELLKVLSPLQALPHVEILLASFHPERGTPNGSWLLLMEMYVTPPMGIPSIVIPEHKCKVTLEYESGKRFNFDEIQLGIGDRISQLVFTKPDKVRFKAFIKNFTPEQRTKAVAELILTPVNAPQSVVIPIPLEWVKDWAWQLPEGIHPSSSPGG